jgi:carboxylesterase type B
MADLNRIYGGGYTLGDKAGSGNPSGLIKASQVSGGQGVIYVAMNYRIGALGWLSGPTLQGSGGVSNAGLYDQRLAIEWVAKYIHLFGGDPKRITLLGESAGGGSVEHQITAFGGQKNVSFQQAIPQSPGFVPVASQFTQENTTQTFLSLLNVTSIEEARNMSSAAVIRANTLQVGASPYGGFTYGPVVDGIFAPQLPGLLLNSGQFAKNVKVMVGHNSQESPPFTPPNVRDDTELEAFLRLTYPGMPPTTLSYIIDTLYPAIYNGSQPYTTPLARTFLIIQESVFTCNTNYINKAFNNQTYAYEFQVPPAFHGRDIQYTYYNGQGTNLSVGLIAPVAQALQAYIVNFAMTGNPNGPGVPMFSMQGKNASMQAINATYIVPQVDDTANVRCAWWQKALYT